MLEVPGFGRRRFGAALYVAVAVAAGTVWGRHASTLLAIRLSAPATAAGVCALLVRRPYIALTTSSGAFSEPSYILSTRTSRIRRWMLRRAAFLVAQTTYAAADLQAFVPRDRTAVIPTPVPSVRPTPLNGKPNVLYSGRMSSEKDLTGLISAWRTIAEEFPNARLTLVGAGGAHRSVEGELRAAVDADSVLKETVTFTGWVNDVGEYLGSADFYVFPSLEEGMSNALLEACAWRRVIVASDIPPNRAVLGDDFPLLFRAGDPAALAVALRNALTDESLRADALQRVGDRVGEFSIHRVVERMEKLIHAAERSRRH